MSDLDELKKEADELGVQYHSTIGANKLQEKIEQFYESQETSNSAVVAAAKAYDEAKAKEETPKASKGAGISDFHRKRMEREKNARQTRIVRIVDNDQRVNSHTNTCVVNCSNEYFDLGTRVLPLNEPIEVMVGHLSVLKDVKIPIHVKDPKSGLSKVAIRPRYAISYEDVDTTKATA